MHSQRNQRHFVVAELAPTIAALLADIERRARPDALLASNTSSLRIADIAAALADPARLVGVHFFNPVAMMPLVEVVRTAATGDEAFRQAAAFVRKLDKLPLPVQEAPGFLVNAVLGPYMYEALRCVDEGIAPEAIDAALTAFGMPMGPIELVDTVGLDIAVAAGKALAGADAVLPRALADKVAAGQLGKKSGQGFYAWPGGKVSRPAAGAIPDGLAARIVAPLLAASQASRSTATAPSGVRKDWAAGTAIPRTYTRWVGHRMSTRRMRSRRWVSSA